MRGLLEGWTMSPFYCPFLSLSTAYPAEPTADGLAPQVILPTVVLIKQSRTTPLLFKHDGRAFGHPEG